MVVFLDLGQCHCRSNWLCATDAGCRTKDFVHRVFKDATVKTLLEKLDGGNVMSTLPNFPMRMMFTSVCLGGLVAAASALMPTTASAQQLRWCANEGGTCRLPYPAEVVFGAQGYTTSRSFDRPAVQCSNRVFGDPAPGLHKACYIVMRGGGYDGGGYGDNYEPRRRGWVACADESDYCDFNGRATVRYGARGQYTVGVFRDGVQCDNDTFGEDPAPGIPKRCYVRQ